MLTELVTKLIKPILDDEYLKGYEAGVQAQMLKEKDDSNRRLHEMYHYGYLEGKSDAEAENAVVDIDEVIASELVV